MQGNDRLTALLDPAITALLTVECQRGVLGPDSVPVQQLAGTPATGVADGIPVAGSDFVLRRLHGLAPLAGTEADALLRNLGIRTLVVSGVSANVAIPNAVFDAVNLGYEAVVPADAIAGVPADYTRAVLRHTLALVATVTTAGAVLDRWKRSGSRH
jgi:nicotinamidase-related amidase